MKAEELRARMGEISSGWGEERVVDITVDRIRQVQDPAERLALLGAVFEGMHDTERSWRKGIGVGRERTRWGTGRVAPWENRAEGPLVCESLGAPPCRFDRRGAVELDYAAMRFIVASRENFDFLLELAAEGLKARLERA